MEQLGYLSGKSSVLMNKTNPLLKVKGYLKIKKSPQNSFKHLVQSESLIVYKGISSLETF